MEILSFFIIFLRFWVDLRRSQSTIQAWCHLVPQASAQDYVDRIGSHGPAVTETYLNLEKLKIKKKRGDTAPRRKSKK